MLPLNYDNKLKLIEHTLSLRGRPSDEARQLLQRVEKDSLAALSENPATLVLLSVAWAESPGQSLPRQRSTLLAEFVLTAAKEFEKIEFDTFVAFASARLHSAGEEIATMLVSEFESVLRLVAAATLEQPELVESELSVIDRLFDEGRLSQEIRRKVLTSRIADVFKEFLLRTGLLVRQGNVLRFGHNLIREYLIARHWTHIAEKNPHNEGVPNEFWRWQDPRRREILAMAIPDWLSKGRFSDLRNALYRIGRASTFGAAFLVDVYVEGADLDKAVVVHVLCKVMQKFNKCSELFNTYKNPSPIPMIRRLISKPDVSGSRDRRDHYSMGF